MYATIKNFLTALCFPRIAPFFVRGIKGRKRRRPPVSHPGGIFSSQMKRRNFLKTLIGAAAAVALPTSAMRDIFIHRGGPMTHDGTHNCIHFGKLKKWTPYYYQTEALRDMNFYQQASRVAFYSPRQQGKTYFLELGNVCHEELEKSMLAMLKKKDQELLQRLSDFEDAESWRRILPKQKRA